MKIKTMINRLLEVQYNLANEGLFDSNLESVIEGLKELDGKVNV